MNKKIQIALFASGNGSNAHALLKAATQCKNIEIALVLTDKSNAFVIERTKQFKVKTEVVEFERTAAPYRKDKESHEKKILDICHKNCIQWIFLAGYMRILSSHFISQYPEKIINIHPSKLPDFPGPKGYEDAFSAGVKSSGITIHFVDEGIDSGEILLQESFDRDPDDTLETFKSKGLKLEHLLYPKVLNKLDEFGELKRGYFE